MGIIRVESLMHKIPNCVTDVDIAQLASGEESGKVIIVDGNQFYKGYIYTRFHWLQGSLVELVEEVRTFVEAFKTLGVELIFFFHKKVYQDPFSRRVWVGRRNKNNEVSKRVLTAVQHNGYFSERITEYRERPVNVKFVVIHTLRNVLQCEVHCTSEPRKGPGYYAAGRRCLAMLSQNSRYVFHEGIPAYLSMKHLDLKKMKTKQYHTDVFFEYLNLKRQFFPLLAAIIGDNELRGTKHPYHVARNAIKKRINQTIESKEFVSKVSQYIHMSFVGDGTKQLPQFLIEQFGEDGETLVPAYYDFEREFKIKVDKPESPCESTHWEKVLEVAQEHFSSGKMHGELYVVLLYNYFQHPVMLEDFKELPPSGLVFRLLRKKMYAILFHEAPDSTKEYGVEEWCVLKDGCPIKPTTVTSEYPKYFHLPHPGNLILWDVNDKSDSTQDKRWLLFGESISTDLDISLLRSLNRNFIVPVAVLFYLQHEIQDTRMMHNWEIEAFITVVLILQSTNVSHLSNINIKTFNARAIRLSAFFICGCRMLIMLAQVCGLEVLSECNISQYYDGKLFHDLYEKILKNWRKNVLDYVPQEQRDNFKKIKKILHLHELR